MNKKSSLIVLPILLSIILTGCGKSNSLESEISATPSISAEQAAAEQAAAEQVAAQQAAAEQAAAQQAAAEQAAAQQAAAEQAAAQQAAAEQAAAQQAAAQQAAAQQDPKFSTCKEAIASGYGPYNKGSVEYSWYQDRDGDGVVCEK